MRRREFIAFLGSTGTVWPLAGHAQQPATPVIGVLGGGSIEPGAERLRAFRQGLGETGYVEGNNVAIEYRWAGGRYDRLATLAADLIRQRVAMIIATSVGPTLAAKAATTTIPVVFIVSEDPVRLGLVASLARPGGNVTGVNLYSVELTAKRLELLHELVPAAIRVAVLINPASAEYNERIMGEVEAAARGIGLQTQVLKAGTIDEINAAFATFARERPDALFVGQDAFFNSRRTQLVHLATHYAVPASYFGRDFAEAGGLMSYGPKITDGYRQAGSYAGRILKGTMPADLPVVQSTKFEFVINAQTATMLGLTVPPQLLASVDDVIE
jgi:putative ABC transport system substrate-binding protein